MTVKTGGSGLSGMTRREMLRRGAAAAAAPYVITSFSLAGTDRPAPSDRVTVGCIGMGGRGSGDMNSFLSYGEVQVVAVCDVVKTKRDKAKSTVDGKYGNSDCASVNDFREITSRKDIDAVMIATPDHWHAITAIEAMRTGKDVFCEKPESLTIREGRMMVEVARRYGRVFSGGSQRVWEDYNWAHRTIYSGGIGQVREAFVNVGGTSKLCDLPAQPIPDGLDWDMWLGPAPWAPFNSGRLGFRAWRDYSGGGMTDWGAHGFGGAMFACQVHTTGPVAVYPPDGTDHKYLTYEFANGLRMYHGGGWGGILSFRGTKGEIPENGASAGGTGGRRQGGPAIFIQNYKGRGGLVGDFLHCVRTRERPFRDIELAHRTVTVCHLGNIAYWLNRPIKWDPVKEEIVGDEEAARWLSRPMRAPWTL
jgi:hypothetical protein